MLFDAVRRPAIKFLFFVNKRNYILLSMFISTFFISFVAQAHPHMFVDVTPKVEKVTKEKLILDVSWYFDPASSEGYIIDFDENGNGKLDKKELEVAAGELVKGLKKFHYFTTLVVNGKKQIVSPIGLSMNVVEVTNKKVKEKVILCNFKLEAKPVGKASSKLNIDLSFYDETVYSVLYPKGTLQSAKGVKVAKNEIKKSKCQYLFTVEL